MILKINWLKNKSLNSSAQPEYNQNASTQTFHKQSSFFIKDHLSFLKYHKEIHHQ